MERNKVLCTADMAVNHHNLLRMIFPVKNFINGCIAVTRASHVALVVKNLPANAGDARVTGSIPGSEKIALEEETETRSSILAWKTPWTEEAGRL